MSASPVWVFYESNRGREVVARSVMYKEDFTDVEIPLGDIPEKEDMIIADPNDFSDKRLMKYKTFVAIFKQIRRDKE